MIILGQYEAPEEWFQKQLQRHDNFPGAAQPYWKLEAKYTSIRDELSKQPEGVTADFFRMFHREDGFLALLQGRSYPVEPKKSGTEKQEKSRTAKQKKTSAAQERKHVMAGVGAVPVDKLDSVLERLNRYCRSYLRNDVYFTVNSMFRGHWRWKVKNTFLRYPARKQSDIRWLNALFTDIDVGRFGCENEMSIGRLFPHLLPKDIYDVDEKSKHRTWEQALFQVMVFEEMGLLPPVSIYARSGRGIYLFWLLEPVYFYHLTDEETTLRGDYYNCQRAINKTLRGDSKEPILPADTNAMDGVRILRIHGSVHSKTKTRVCYFPSKLEDVDPNKIYTLKKMLDFFGIEEKKIVKPEPEKKIFKQAEKPKTAPARKHGVLASFEYRLDDLTKLFKDGHIRQGQRYFTLRNMAWFCFRLHMEEAEAVKRLKSMARLCRPPYPTKNEANDVAVSLIVNSVYHAENPEPFFFNNQVLAKFWKIDKETADRLKLRVLRPLEAGKAKVESDKQEEITRRRETIRMVLHERPEITQRDLLTSMRKRRFKISRTTLLEDLKVLRDSGATEIPRKRIRKTEKQ